MNRIRKFHGVILTMLLLVSLVSAHSFFNKPKDGFLIELPNPDEMMGRNLVLSRLKPVYTYYVQVQILTPEGFKTVYSGSSSGSVLIPPSELSRLTEGWKDVKPAVLVDVWLLNREEGTAQEVGTFSTRLDEKALRGLQTFSLKAIDKRGLHPISAPELSKKGNIPITPTRGHFVGYRWRTKKTYLREDDFPAGMYLPVLILDNREGKATVMGMYKVEVRESSSGSSGFSVGFSTTIIRGSRLSSKSEFSVERGLQNGEIRVDVQEGNEFTKSIIDGEVKDVTPGDIGLIAIKGEPYIALQVLQKCYVNEFREMQCFDTDEERVLITISDVERHYETTKGAYLIETHPFVNPPRSIYPSENFERLVQENAKFRKLATLHGQQNRTGRSSYMETFLDEYDTYSETDIPLLAIAVALQPETWPEFLLGLSIVGSVYITNEEHERAYGAFAVVDQSKNTNTTVSYATLKYSVENANHRTRFLFAYLQFE